MKRLIVTGDDFGASTLVNEAIEQAHRAGVLNTTCLMMSGAAVDDAVRRAKRLPALRVGLHVVLVDGRPLLDASLVGALVDADGAFSTHLVRAGFRMFFSARARTQLEDEIRAQFEAFATTGLPLDHVNGHNHMQVHPTVLDAIIRIGREYGMKAMRVPYEPLGPSWRAMRQDLAARAGNSLGLAPVLGYCRWRLRTAGIACNDYVFGLSDTGRMTRERVLALLRELPDGVTEMYFHPASRRAPGMPAYAQPEAELAALLDPGVASYIADGDIKLSTYSQLEPLAS